MADPRIAKPKSYVGLIVNFDSDKYCKWGPSDGHYVKSINGKILTLARDKDSYEDNHPRPIDLCEVDLTSAIGYYNNNRSIVQFD